MKYAIQFKKSVVDQFYLWGSFLRKNGFYTSNVKQWKDEMRSGLLVGKKNLHKIEKYKENIESQKAIEGLRFS